jgi:hypothetical protein
VLRGDGHPALSSLGPLALLFRPHAAGVCRFPHCVTWVDCRMSSRLRPALQSFDFTPDLDGWLAAHTPVDANARSRERVMEMFRNIIARTR